MSVGADPQNTLRDYFERHSGKEHDVIANMYGDEIEFYIKPKGMEEKDGMHFILNLAGKITEVGVWE